MNATCNFPGDPCQASCPSAAEVQAPEYQAASFHSRRLALKSHPASLTCFQGRLAAFLAALCASLVVGMRVSGQSADWTAVVWREPQVRYLLADMTLNGGKTDLYRKYATEEKDPDSREAIRLWDIGVRVVNTNDFERKWVASQFAKDGRMMRIVQRGTERTILGNEVLLTSDTKLNQGIVRMILAELSLGRSWEHYNQLKDVGDVAEALRRWNAGTRLLNTNLFGLSGPAPAPELVYRSTGTPVKDPTHFRFNSDLSYPEGNVRYFLADMFLGGSRDFYWRTAEVAHEMGCLEAVLRFDAGVKITNLDRFERKKVDGKVLITLKGSDQRISGMLVKLSSDLP